MLSPKQAFYILSLAGLLNIPFASALTTPSLPTSTLSATTFVTKTATRGVGAPFPIEGTSTAVGTGIVGTGTGVPFPTGTGSPNPGNGKPGLAVWWGQSTSDADLEQQCEAEGVDVVIVSFVTNFNRAGGFPEFNINTASGPSEAQTAAGATDLIDGAAFVPGLEKCRANNKKVYVSLGGQTGKIVFNNQKEAETAAQQVFDLFLSGDDPEMKPLRPFGDFVMDGVDFDMENKNPKNYVAFTKKLRQLMDTDKSANFQIGAAPQCPREGQPNNQDASLPDEVLKLTDHVWVQFYNNGPCNHGESGFMDSVKEWSKAVEPAKLWVAAPGAEEGAGSGHIDAAAMKKEIAQVKNLKLSNFGGYALWDGPISIDNDNYDTMVKQALEA